MNETVKQALFEKNARIIDAVRRRAERLCPGTLDMIAVTGSFASGDYHEKSDLDLLIVIGDASGYALSHCFILDDVGYDLYCHTWERLEEEAAYESPYVSKLLDAQIVYCREESHRRRFQSAAEKLRAHLAGPLTKDDYDRAVKKLHRAKQAYFDFLAAGADGGYAYPLYQLMHHLECAVYLLNHAVVRHGVRGICAELASMPSLPDAFCDLHAQLYSRTPYTELQESAMTLILNTGAWIQSYRACVQPRAAANAECLRGSLEELVSNYQNKLLCAAASGDRYLSGMTLASAELFLCEMAEGADIHVPVPFGSESYRDPVLAAEVFFQAKEQLAERYHACGLSVCQYEDIEAFESDYAAL